MFKYAVIFLIVSIIAGALGMTNISQLAKRISLVLFALFFVLFLAAVGFALLVGEALKQPAAIPATLVQPAAAGHVKCA